MCTYYVMCTGCCVSTDESKSTVVARTGTDARQVVTYIFGAVWGTGSDSEEKKGTKIINESTQKKNISLYNVVVNNSSFVFIIIIE